MRIKFVLVVIVMLLGSTAQADIQGLELPSGSQVSWVASDIIHNGQDLAIKALSCQCSAEDVLSFYRTSWEEQGDTPGYVENQMEGWQIISRLSDSHNVVVQVKSSLNGTTEGFVSSMSLRSQPLRAVDQILVPPNAVKVSNTRTQDKGKTAHTAILVTPSGVASTVGFYKDHLERSGWSIVSDEFVEGSYVLKFNKSMAAIEIVVNAADDGTTVILLNRTQRNG